MINLIAKKTVELSINKSVDLEIERLQKLIKSKETQIEKLLDSIEDGIPANRVASRITEREKEISEIKTQISIQKAKRSDLSEDKVRFFLTDLVEGYTDDWKYRKLLIDMLVSKVYLYDGRLTISFDFEGKQAKARLDYNEGAQIDGVWINPLTLHHNYIVKGRYAPSFCYSISKYINRYLIVIVSSALSKSVKSSLSCWHEST